MLEVELKNETVTCSELENKGKMVYADNTQFPLETIQYIQAHGEPFDLTFYNTLRIISGSCFDEVEKVELLEKGNSLKYKVHLASGDTETVQRKIKSATG